MDNSSQIKNMFATPVSGSGNKLPAAASNAAKAGESQPASERSIDRAKQQIMEKGFRTYVEELPLEKRKEAARASALLDLNITEKDLNRLQKTLSPQQYQELIDRVDDLTQVKMRQHMSENEAAEPPGAKLAMNAESLEILQGA